MSIKSYLRSICLAVGMFTGAVACTTETAEPVTPVDPGTAPVRLSIVTPSSSLPVVTRSNATADESKVSRIKLVVLQLSGDQYRYRYMVDGQRIIQSNSNSEITNFDALLSSSDIPIKILLLANYNDAFDDEDIFTVNMTEAAIKELLNDTFHNDIEGDLPLYGEISLTQLKADQTNYFSVTMLRAIARVDVYNTIDREFSEDFRLNDVYIYRANDMYSLIPDETAMTTPGVMTVSSASIPEGASRYGAYSKPVAADGDLSIIKSYLPESLPVSDETLRTSTATCVVVGGYYADDNFLSYYRIDFDSGYEGHPFGQVLRNHKYIFNIIQVNGRGWLTPDEAAENEATAITATMQVWNEVTSEMWFSGDENYLGISSRRVVLNYYAGSEKTETLQATVPFTIRYLDSSGNPAGPTITSSGGILTTDFYTLEVKKDTSEGDDIWKLVITSTGDNYTNAEFTGRFQVYTDWWTFDVDVIQETYAGMLASQYVRILTITDLDGDLGTTDGTFTGASGEAMRKVLENTANFSPQGTVTIGGIIVYDLKNATVTSQESSDMYILQKVLGDVDVVHLPGECTPSPAAASLIIDWHQAEPNRVLIIGLDSESTNANLRSYIYEVEGVDPNDPSSGTWLVNTTVRALERSYAEPETERFFNGPFGEVASGIMGLSKTSMIGYNNGYNAQTTVSLIWIQDADDIEFMTTHGVNTGSGIFYCGDSGVTSSRGNAMSNQANQNGKVHSDFDRLMANVWAWIVERVSMITQVDADH